MPGFVVRDFSAAPGDPLAAEHAVVSQWQSDAVKSLGPHNFYRDIDLKTMPAGQKLLDGDPEQARRYVLAALAQVQHWDAETDRVRAHAAIEGDDVNVHLSPYWADVWGSRRQAAAVLSALMRRALPFTENDLTAFANWMIVQKQISTFHAPIKSITKAIERYARLNPVSDKLRGVLRRLAVHLRNASDKEAKQSATTVEQVCSAGGDDTPETANGNTRPVSPAPAGHAAVLARLKCRSGMAEQMEAGSVTTIGPDQFPLRTDSPLSAEHALLTAYFQEVIGTAHYSSPKLPKIAVGRQIIAMDAASRGRVVLAACERSIFGLTAPADLADHASWQSRHAATTIVASAAALGCTFDRAGGFDFLLFFSTRPGYVQGQFAACLKTVMHDLFDTDDRNAAGELSEGERFVLSLLRESLIKGPPFGSPSEDVIRLSQLIQDGATFYLAPTEQWSVMLNQQIAALPLPQRSAWTALLRHSLTATAARPSDKWSKTAATLVNDLGIAKVRASLMRWFAQVPGGRATVGVPGFYGDARTQGDVIQEENANVLRGLLWIAPSLNGGDEMIRAVSVVAQSAYRKVPGVGPRAVKVGNAAVYALSQINSAVAVGQLAVLKVRVKFGTAQKEIGKAFTAAAEALNIPRDEIEEMGVPAYGLAEVGRRMDAFGDAVCETTINGRAIVTAWTRAGKSLKSAPANIKADFKEDLAELKGAVKDIAAMLPAQSQRLDSMFLSQKAWTVPAWRERYLDHPLIGTIARRLIWEFRHDGVVSSGVWLDDRVVDACDAPLAITAGAEVRLWHPIGRPTDDVLAWRSWLGKHEICQPFKQAHREVYLLTDAERRTNTYSNRFAAHVIRQHQFNALCAARGWKNKLRLMVDDSYPPASRDLSGWGLRAEFWIEGIGTDYGADTNESGTYVRLSTDQVRFYRVGAATSYAHAGGGGYATAAAGPGTGNVNEPLPLEQIPPLVLSEIMRDVDLFVGVASVGNDPTWQDGGPDGRYQAYWQNYSFGTLTETANTRRDVLASLLPRLTKIRDRCSLVDRFLVVRGDLRTYKIHLGSGNILMEPNDQYLCIVPDRRSAGDKANVFLPFEGDATLSIILSKAFLLAEDAKIKDATITRQINAE